MLCSIQIITTEEAERRGQVYDRQGATYLFDLDYVEDEYTIDAAHYGNVSHFVNHSVSSSQVHRLHWNFSVIRLFECPKIKKYLHLSYLYPTVQP